MAPKYKSSDNPDAWWQNAYISREDIVVEYEYAFGKDVMTPGTKFKIKNKRGTFKFRCFARNIRLDSEWVDCIDVETGEWRAFRPAQIKGIVKPKRKRKKKTNETLSTS